MCKLDKATDLYLRGFNSQYIKRRTGISMQSLLKRLLAKGVKYTKMDILDYQTSYIKSKYDEDYIIQAYKDLMAENKDLDKLKRGRHITVLGCGFGDYVGVFKALLGVDEYKTLRNICWYEKQSKSVKDKYGVDNVFCKEVFSDIVSDESVLNGRLQRTSTIKDRYGVEHPNQNKEIAKRMVESTRTSNMLKYGVPNVMQNSDIARKSANSRQKSMLIKYGYKNSVEIPEIRNKIFESRRNNKTLNSSLAEEKLGELLREWFGSDDVLRNVIVDDRYPYHVDYYIKSRDLFIELNGDKCHNDHWFDENNERDNQILSSWMNNMIRLENETGKASRYRKYIKTWSQTDVAKRNIARDNNLNYLVFWDGSCKQRNKKSIPLLRDAFEWFDANCPMPNDWRAENTY